MGRNKGLERYKRDPTNPPTLSSFQSPSDSSLWCLQLKTQHIRSPHAELDFPPTLRALFRCGNGGLSSPFPYGPFRGPAYLMVRRLLGTDEGGALLRSSTDCSRGLLLSAPEATLSALSMSYLEMRRKEFGGSPTTTTEHLKRGQRGTRSRRDLQGRTLPVGGGVCVHSRLSSLVFVS